jgi:hypothetical protein
LDGLKAIATYFTGLDIFDPTADFITAAQLADTLATAII